MSPGTQDVSSTSDNTVTKTQGRVKWFNNRAGYGFITVSAGENKDTDVFVHHSSIQVSKEQYRYLMQGEYVEFKMCELEDANHKWQAGEVSGVGGGQLMCETRLETRASRSKLSSEQSSEMRSKSNSYRDSEPSSYRVRSRGPGPREGDEWMLVRRKPPSNRTRGTATESPNREVMRPRTSDRNNKYT